MEIANSELKLSEVWSNIYLSSCPGKNLEKGRDKKVHKRNLSEDLIAIKSKGITRIICLLNDFEIRSLGVKPDAYRNLSKENEIEFIQLPIIEMRTPEISVNELYSEFITKLMANPKPTLIHCRGGVGRAGMLASCLISYNHNQSLKFKEIVEILRKRRDKRCIESTKQMDYAKEFHLFCKKCSTNKT